MSTMIWIVVTATSTVLLAASGTIKATGQKYADRGYGYQSLDLEEDYDLDLVTDYYEWNKDDPEVWRWNVKDFPHPQLEPRFCHRMAPSNVCDPDQILTKDQADSLDSSIRSLYNDTPCICETCIGSNRGIQIGIAILKNTWKPHNEIPSKIIQSFAKNLRSKWRLGDCDDDILIVVATDDRQSYTDVGRATSSFISQEEAYRIFLENKAHFSAGRYYDGLKAMLKNYQTATSKIHKAEEVPEVAVGEISGIVFGTLLLLAMLTLIAVMAYKKCKNIGGSNTNGSDTLSSTWKRKINLSPSHISSHETYKPCKTEDEPIPEEDKDLIAELANPERTTSVAIPEQSDNHDSNTGASPEDAEQSTTLVKNTDKNPMVTFVPKKSTEFHQTDL